MNLPGAHYSDVIISTIASQTSSLTIVYSTVYSSADQSKHQNFASLALVRGNSPMTGEFPAQRANNAEYVSIWWRHHGLCDHSKTKPCTHLMGYIIYSIDSVRTTITTAITTTTYMYIAHTHGSIQRWHSNKITSRSLRWRQMGAIASQITSLSIVYSTVYSGADQSKHQSSASLAFVWGIHRGPVNSPHKGPVTRKMFPFDDVIMVVKIQVSIKNT